MKSKWVLFSSIFQLVIGITAIVAYIVVVASGELISKWTITLLLAIAFVIMGVVGIIEWNRANKKD
ncbi:MAG: hypothetical protein IJN61_05995 [Clostridia bacterium]|nr:hypothetical protein [Clostridia bacterium]